MSAEIFFLRLEAFLRDESDVIVRSKSRFVPFLGHLER